MQQGETAFVTLFVHDGTIRVDYAVDNIAMQKTLVRQTFVHPDISAHYAGAFRLRMAVGSTPYGTREDNADFLVHLNGQGEGVLRVEDAIPGVCEYRGPYVQRGRYGGVTGSLKLTGPEGTGTGRFGAVRQ